MKILWVTAQVLPYVGEVLEVRTSGFGGWITNMIEQLRHIPDMMIGIAMVSEKVSAIVDHKVDANLTCYVAPALSNKTIATEDMNTIIDKFRPDIIHIEGNEYGIQNCFSRINSIPVLVSLQGILSGYEPYQYGELPIADNLFTAKNKMMISSWILYFRKKKKFNSRVSIETQTIQNAHYLMGRTYWDRAHSYWINPKARYFSCNRILRPDFYDKSWTINNIERHSIFIGNGYSPLKGLHFALQAVALLKNEFPDVKIYCTGEPPIEKNKKSIKYFGYSKIVSNIIDKYNLHDNIEFLGPQLANKMIDRMLLSNVYVLPSLIENSPNTLGEAMILGMPCVSAYTGGASEMAIDECEALFYRANDPNLLAWQIKRIFENDEFAIQLGKTAKKHAIITHDPIANRDALIAAYKAILSEK